MMKKYAIYFGKDPEELDFWCWSDNYKEDEAVGVFETDDKDFFWRCYLGIRDNPPAMWYWVFIDGKQIMSGAIDPDDIDAIREVTK